MEIPHSATDLISFFSIIFLSFHLGLIVAVQHICAAHPTRGQTGEQPEVDLADILQTLYELRIQILWNFILLQSNFYSNDPIRTQCHGSWAVLECAKLWLDEVIIFP